MARALVDDFDGSGRRKVNGDERAFEVAELKFLDVIPAFHSYGHAFGAHKFFAGTGGEGTLRPGFQQDREIFNNLLLFRLLCIFAGGGQVGSC